MKVLRGAKEVKREDSVLVDSVVPKVLAGARKLADYIAVAAITVVIVRMCGVYGSP
jgi:hypothetical protein